MMARFSTSPFNFLLSAGQRGGKLSLPQPWCLAGVSPRVLPRGLHQGKKNRSATRIIGSATTDNSNKVAARQRSQLYPPLPLQ